jgi:tRNA-specific 2-thiouridylase
MNTLKTEQNTLNHKNTPKKRVFLGMSGGVDSSVSACLLKEQGYDVTGVFINVWQPSWINCTSKEDRRDAMRVASLLDIPFITLDLEEEYKKEVVDYMIDEYKKGKTPNPDVMCNQYVKFGGFFDWAIKNGADYVATGHYAQIKGGKLYAGTDKNKDQSYFLYTLKKEHLNKTLFPVGNIEKTQVRELAKKFNLPNAIKKDSQGLCFIGKVDIKDFLARFIQEKKGDVLDEKRNIVGSHNGAFFFTIGERHGFEIFKKTPNDAPYYVISKDIDKNTITVANKNEKGELPSSIKRIKLKNVNWNQGSVPMYAWLKARSRYREELQDIKVISENEVEFKNEQYTISSGQSLVIYDGELCLGGGSIA